MYTETDLARPHILVPEDSARAEAKRNECAQQDGCPLVSSQNPPANLNEDSFAPEISLGDVARKYRKLKQLQGQKDLQALQAKHPAPFHLPFSTPALASPVLPGRRAARVPLHQPHLAPVIKRDPFRVMRKQPVVAMPTTIRPRSTLAARPVATPQPNATVRSVETALPERPPAPAKISSPKSVSVGRGDSLWKLAQQNLGRGNRWHELLQVNPWIADPNKILAGARINIPAVSAPTGTPPRIKLQKGDSMWRIAQRQFGRGALWSCIARVNPDIQDANLIREGQVLLLPVGCAP